MITSGQLERWYPLVGGSIAGGGYLYAVLVLGVNDSPKELLSAAINVSSIMVGFLATMKSILLSYDRNRLAVQMKQANKFRTLVTYVMRAITLCILTAGIAGVLLFLEPHRVSPWYGWALTGWVVVCCWSALACHRSITVLSQILSS